MQSNASRIKNFPNNSNLYTGMKGKREEKLFRDKEEIFFFHLTARESCKNVSDLLDAIVFVFHSVFTGKDEESLMEWHNQIRRKSLRRDLGNIQVLRHHDLTHSLLVCLMTQERNAPLCNKNKRKSTKLNLVLFQFSSMKEVYL